VAVALASGKAIIATDCPGGTRDLLGGGKYGVLVRNEDIEALQHALADTLPSDEKLESMRLAACSADTLHSAEAISDRWLSLFDRVLALRRLKS
jgi:glycosyltransferase involved in cell wall biosynthesis